MIPTYYEMKYANSSKIFEAEQIKDLNPDQILEAEKAYYTLVEKLKNNEPLDEGFLGSILGGATGALIGPSLGKILCKVLGIQENGTLGTLLCSRIVSASIGYELGKKA